MERYSSIATFQIPLRHVGLERLIDIQKSKNVRQHPQWILLVVIVEIDAQLCFWKACHESPHLIAIQTEIQKRMHHVDRTAALFETHLNRLAKSALRRSTSQSVKVQ